VQAEGRVPVIVRIADIDGARVAVVACDFRTRDAHAACAQVQAGAPIAVLARAGVRSVHAVACVAVVIGALVSVVAVDPLTRVDEYLNFVNVEENRQVRVCFRFWYFRLNVWLMELDRVGNRAVLDRAVHAAGAVPGADPAQPIRCFGRARVREPGSRLP